MAERLLPLAVPISEAVKIAALGRTTFYKLLNDGSIPAKKCGGRTLILMADLEGFLNSLPNIKGGHS